MMDKDKIDELQKLADNLNKFCSDITNRQYDEFTLKLCRAVKSLNVTLKRLQNIKNPEKHADKVKKFQTSAYRSAISLLRLMTRKLNLGKCEECEK